VWLGLLSMGAFVLYAEAARAQTALAKHHLTVQLKNCQTDVEADRFDGHAEAFCQGGVQGTNPSFFIHEGVADGDSGLLSIFSRFSSLGGAGDPIFVRSDPRSVASIEESIDPGNTPSGPVTITARFNWDGSGSLVDGSGDTDSGSVSAGLTVNNCSVSFRQTFYSDPNVLEPGEEVVNCSQSFYVTSIGSAGAGLLSVTQIIENPAKVPTRFYVTASISGEVNQVSTLEYFDSGEYEASGHLSIEVSGVDFTYSSPTFLTVPEPGAAALAATAMAVLATRARRRR
jgi:hypothetical protein